MTTVYNFKQNTVVIAGMIATGYADGDAIQAERNEDKRSQTVGAAGEVTYNESNNDTGTFTLLFKPNSPTLVQLRALFKSGELFPVMIKDNANNIQVTGEDCVVSNSPPFSRAEEVSAVEVTILAAKFTEN